jgi:geranylgeranyl pyrophosphate synthase
LYEGKITLPFIILRQLQTTKEFENIKKLAGQPQENFHTIVSLMRDKQVFDQCDHIAKDHSQAAITALNALENKPLKKSLTMIANILLERKS